MKVLLVSVLVVLASAKPASHKQIERYASLHPNTEVDADPEYLNPNGDILGEDQINVDPLNAVVNPARCWPNGVLHYRLSSAYTSTQRRLIQAAIDELTESTKVNGRTCIQILPRTSQRGYVNVGKNSGCSSFVGRTSGAQAMSLVDSCVTRHGTIMHEFLHAFGFYHEQSRTDRDDFVFINYDNIRAGTERNFRRYTESEISLLGTSYDYGSVMHYSAYGFAIDRNIPTIITLDPTAVIGQRLKLSDLDIERVQILYGCLNAADSVHFKHLANKRFDMCA